MKILLFYFGLALASAVNQHNYYWRDYRGTIPDDALWYEGLYIAQVPYNGVLPATLYPETKKAVSECWGRKIVIESGIKILCDQSREGFSWESVNVNSLTEQKLENYVVGGLEDGSTLYIGKVFHEDQWKIGKVFPPTSQWKGLRVWCNNGDKYVTENFEILKYETLPIDTFNVREEKKEG